LVGRKNSNNNKNERGKSNQMGTSPSPFPLAKVEYTIAHTLKQREKARVKMYDLRKKVRGGKRERTFVQWTPISRKGNLLSINF